MLDDLEVLDVGKSTQCLSGTPMTELRNVTCYMESYKCYLLPDTSECTQT